MLTEGDLCTARLPATVQCRSVAEAREHLCKAELPVGLKAIAGTVATKSIANASIGLNLQLRAARVCDPDVANEPNSFGNFWLSSVGLCCKGVAEFCKRLPCEKQ